ncbi:hypothetical protein HMPREF9278_0288 [Mobiluncus mulieris FB024-16]|nr:hypothetical protein HMPREF9278_0288 [Mobiluncus mulieris FB024-16]
MAARRSTVRMCCVRSTVRMRVAHRCTVAAPSSLTRVVLSLRRRFPAAHLLSCGLCEWELRLERRGDWLSYPYPFM